MVESRRKKIQIKSVLSHYDIILAILVLFICSFGLVMIYSASSYRAEYYYKDSTLYFRRQGLFLLGGAAVMILISLIDYKTVFKKIKLFKFRIPLLIFFWLICIGLHWWTFFNGYSAGGSARWIQLGGGINFQPSELSKVCFVLFGTVIARKNRKLMNTGNILKDFWGYLRSMFWFAPILVPVALQNLSSAIILAGIVTMMFFCISMQKKYFWIVVALLAVGAYAMVNIKEYRSERMGHFWNDENMDSGDQILQGMYAIASGGLMGKGLGNSVQKLGNIPEVHTDMIFVIICEELGIIGGIAVIGLFLLLLWRIFKIAINAPDFDGSLIAIGIFAQIALQVMMNVAVVTNSMPATGVPLPFVSYGGSSLLILMAEMGVVLGVSKRTYEPIDDIETPEKEK